MIDPRTFAATALQLLQADPARYRNYGVYWFLVKALMRRYYTRNNLYLLGDYVDPTVVDRMPEHGSLQDALRAAAETYQQNASFNLKSSKVIDPEGEEFELFDTDAGL